MRILLLLITFLIVQCKPEEKIIIPKKPALAMKAKSKLPPADLDYIMGKFDPKSATRNFDYQKGIWERKYTGATKLSDGTNVATDIKDTKDKCLKILEYSSMPSTSRHHWGTDIDINAFNNAYFESGEGKKLYTWMLTHAADYGWCQPYTPHGPDRPHGYFEEKWHWSYMPISKILTQQAEAEFKDEMITGFMGSEAATEIGVVEKYVLGINKACR